MKKGTNLYISCGVSAIALGIAPAMAQTVDSPPPRSASAAAVAGLVGTEDIVVTANKRSESASRIGMAISAFSGDFLREARIADAEDLAQRIPGFTVSKSFANTPIYTIRGVGFQTSNLSSTSPVGVYVDEVAFAYPYMASEVLFDLERVEVLKGPQGTLYGRNTTGGVISYITAKPTSNFRAGIDLTYGSYQTAGIDAFVSGPVTQSLGARAAVHFETRDKGWQYSISRPGDRLGKYNRIAARGTLHWEAGAGAAFTLTGNYWHNEGDTQATQAISYIPLAPAFAPPGGVTVPTFTNARQAEWTPAGYPGTPGAAVRPPLQGISTFYNATLRGEIELGGGITLTSVTGYNNVTRDDTVDPDGLALEVNTIRATGRIASFSQELRLAGQSAKLDWIVGGNYSHDTITENQVFYGTDLTPTALARATTLLLKTNPALAAVILGVPPAAVPGFTSLAAFNTAPYSVAQILNGATVFGNKLSERNTTYGLFANLRYEIVDGLRLVAAARYTEDDLHFRGCSVDVDDITNPVNGPFFATALLRQPNIRARGDCFTVRNDLSGFSGEIVNRLKQNNVSWRGGFEYTPAEGTLLYGNVSRGYKSGAFPVVPATTERQLDPIGQERVTAYEGGLKTRLLDRAVNLSLAGFYYDYDNKQLFARLQDPIFGPLPALVNIPKSKVYGAEVEVRWQPYASFSIRASGTYLFSEVKRYTGIDEFNVTRDYKGRPFTFSPKWSASVSPEYTVSLGSDMSINFALDYSFQSRSYGSLSADPRFIIESRNLIDARVKVGPVDNRWSATLWARNLFDQRYSVTRDAVADSLYQFQGMPRTIGLTLHLGI